MFLSEAAFGLCLVFLLCTFAAQVVASRKGDKRRLHGIRLVLIGLSLSACAYLFHIVGGPPGSPLSLLSLLFRIGGITLLWLAWKDHWVRQREQLLHLAEERQEAQENDEGPQFQTALPPEYQEVYSCLNSQAREVLCAAQEEALRRCQVRVETDHLLLGLLRVPQCAASRILERSQVTAEGLRQELAKHVGEEGDALITTPALSPRVRQALSMAQIEAHRFGKTFVGSEHLLLGLLLIGTGPAASALFASGLTVDEIRREVIASAKRNASAKYNASAN